MLCTDEREMCASRAIYLTEWWLCGRSFWLCTNRLDVFSITRWPWLTTTGKAFNTTKFVNFYSKWFKPPSRPKQGILFLFGNSLKNSCAVYCFIFPRTLIKCLSSTENSIVFIIINNNNPTSQIITSSQSQSKKGSGVVDKFNDWVGNCQRNSCTKNVKIKITIQKLWRESYWPFCGHCVVSVSPNVPMECMNHELRQLMDGEIRCSTN